MVRPDQIANRSPGRSRPGPARRVALVLGPAAWLAGCALTDPSADMTASTPTPTTSTVVVGDWNDIEAAVLAAASEREMAVVSTDSIDEQTQAYRLRTIGDEPAVLVIQRSGEQGGQTQVRARCAVGRFGDPHRERALLDAFARRLRDLAGVQTRPLD